MTPEQREAAAQAVSAQLAWWWRMTQTDDLMDPRSNAPWWEEAAKVALRAVQEDGFVVLSRGDVTEERQSEWDELDLTVRRSVRLVTRWEPIANTKEDA